MKRIFTPIFILGLMLPMLLFQSSADSTLIFDADLSFTPDTGKRFHYWMYTGLYGWETRWANRTRLGGAINSVWDDIIHSSGDGVVNAEVNFTVYETFNISGSLDDPSSYGGSGGMAPGYGAESPPPGGANQANWEWGHVGDFFPAQGSTDPGGGGGSTPGERPGASEDFYITPIFENNLGYTISSSGRLLKVAGLETIGDIVSPTMAQSQAEGYFDPTRCISVRQIFQVSHFLILPDYTLHVGESWKAPFWWNVPLIGKPMKIPLTYTLEEIRTLYRFKCAKISFTGLTELETDLVDENYTRRKESHVEGDIIINGTIYFDIDRGVVVAMKNEYAFERGTNHNFWSRYNFGSIYWGFVAIMSFDRIDLITPLGNVIDPRTEKEHVLQEFFWSSDLVME